MVGKNIQEHPEHKNYKFFSPPRTTLDIFNQKQLKKYMQDHNIDTIINAAGRVGGIQDNIKNSFNFLHENLIIGMNLACVVRELDIPRVLNLGSSCLYPKCYQSPISEDCLLSDKLEETNEGYALAKITTLKYFEYLSGESPFSYKTLMPCNLYGRFDSFTTEKSHLIAASIMKIALSKDGDSIEIWGDGTARREFMDALDLADAIFFSLKNYDKLPEVINVGTGIDYSIKEYYKIVADIIGRDCNFIFNKNRPVGMKRKLLDVGKIHRLGWKHKISLLDGLKRSYDYYKEIYL